MKTKIIAAILGMVLSATVFAQKKTETFKVWGNCNMCKETIEGALKKKDGILSKNWNKDTKEISVTYDTTKISIKQIGEKIAAAGYDNQYAKATDEAYKNLHKCCQYERAKN
ncbi:MAG: cation transporter [Bacteroidetes bacterium]|nr:cation transporter [Bacteroidota bacterium]